MATVKELEAQVAALRQRVDETTSQMPTLPQFVELKQLVVGVSMSLDKKLGEFNAEILAIKQKIGMYYVAAQANAHKPQPPKKAAASKSNPPWWIPLPEFKNWLVTISQTDENTRVANLLNRHLKSAARYGEGQLYIDWRKRVDEDVCEAFWLDHGFDGIPDGL